MGNSYTFPLNNLHFPMAEAGCGRTRYTKRILNGQEASRGQFPWIAHIRTFTSSNAYMACGGTLIAPQWVVSAAHCFE